MTTTVRTTILEVYIHDGVDWQYDATAFAASCSFGFDQRYAEATVRRTGGGEIAVQYWSPVEIRLGCTPGEGAATRFKGYVVPVDNALYPIEGTLTCRGTLYRAAWVRNNAKGGTDLAPSGSGASPTRTGADGADHLRGALHRQQHRRDGQGPGLRLHRPGQPPRPPAPSPGPRASRGLDYIEALDAVSVPDAATGRYRTFESLNGEVFRIPMATVPAADRRLHLHRGGGRPRRPHHPRPRRRRQPGDRHRGPQPPGRHRARVESVDGSASPSSSAFAPYLPAGPAGRPRRLPRGDRDLRSPLIEKAHHRRARGRHLLPGRGRLPARRAQRRHRHPGVLHPPGRPPGPRADDPPGQPPPGPHRPRPPLLAAAPGGHLRRAGRRHPAPALPEARS